LLTALTCALQKLGYKGEKEEEEGGNGGTVSFLIRDHFRTKKRRFEGTSASTKVKQQTSPQGTHSGSVC